MRLNEIEYLRPILFIQLFLVHAFTIYTTTSWEIPAGIENIKIYDWIAKSIGTKVYFAYPYSSWQKGAIENVNGLIRQYIPKNTSFSNISHQQTNKIMQKINTRPREKLNFSIPKECFYEKIS